MSAQWALRFTAHYSLNRLSIVSLFKISIVLSNNICEITISHVLVLFFHRCIQIHNYNKKFIYVLPKGTPPVSGCCKTQYSLAYSFPASPLVSAVLEKVNWDSGRVTFKVTEPRAPGLGFKLGCAEFQIPRLCHFCKHPACLQTTGMNKSQETVNNADDLYHLFYLILS